MLFTQISLPLVVALLPLSGSASVLKSLTGIVPENADGSLPILEAGPASAAIPSRALNARHAPAERGRRGPDGCAVPARRPATSDEATPTPTPSSDPDSEDHKDDEATVGRPTMTRGRAGARRPRPTPSRDLRTGSDDHPTFSDDPTSTTHERERATSDDPSSTTHERERATSGDPSPTTHERERATSDDPTWTTHERERATSDDPTWTTLESKKPTPTDDGEDVAESEDAAPEPTEDSKCTGAGGAFLNGMLDPIPAESSSRC